MSKVFFIRVKNIVDPGNIFAWIPDEKHHLLRVLRASPGSQIIALDTKGHQQKAILEKDASNDFVIRAQAPALYLPPPLLASLCLCVGVIKGTAMAWLIEKSVELGVGAIQPLWLERSVVKSQDSDHFTTRLQKIADAASKQSQQAYRTLLHPPTTLVEWYATRQPSTPLRWCFEKASPTEQLLVRSSVPELERADILLGPEGGFSPSEQAFLSSRTAMYSLGAEILRVETACVVALTMVKTLLQLQPQPQPPRRT